MARCSGRQPAALACASAGGRLLLQAGELPARTPLWGDAALAPGLCVESQRTRPRRAAAQAKGPPLCLRRARQREASPRRKSAWWCLGGTFAAATQRSARVSHGARQAAWRLPCVVSLAAVYRRRVAGLHARPDAQEQQAQDAGREVGRAVRAHTTQERGFPSTHLPPDSPHPTRALPTTATSCAACARSWPRRW